MPRPFGYTIDGHVVPEEARVVHEIAARVLAQESLHTICKDMHVRFGWRCSPSRIRGLLTSPRYAGMLAGKGPGPHRLAPWEPILSVETWERVQAMLAAVPAGKGRRPTSLLANIARCGLCGAPMTASKTGQAYTYRCNKGVGGCGRVARNRAHLDTYVTDLLLSETRYLTHMDPEVAKAIRQFEKVNAARIANEEEVEALRAKLERGEIGSNDYYFTLGVLRRRGEEIGAEWRAASAWLDQATHASRAREQWQTWTMDQKRAFIQARVDMVLVLPSKPGRRKALHPEEVLIESRGGPVRANHDAIARKFAETRQHYVDDKKRLADLLKSINEDLVESINEGTQDWGY